MAIIKTPYNAPRNQAQQQEIISTAIKLVEKLGQHMTWDHREAGFEEWAALVDALNASDESERAAIKKVQV